MDNFKTWTWPEIKSRMSGFWPIGHGLPPDVLSGGPLLKSMRDAFIAGPEAFFSPLKASQPLVFESLMRFRDVELVQNARYPILFDFAAIAGDHFVLIEPFSPTDDKPEYWTQFFKHVPDFLQCYYKNFNGMRGSKRSPGAPGNLPANSTKWYRVADYAKEQSINKKDLTRLKEDFGDLDNLHICIKTDWKDLVFLDFNTTTRNVFVIPEGKFMDYFRLDDARGAIDNLCAHVIDGTSEPMYLREYR